MNLALSLKSLFFVWSMAKKISDAALGDDHINESDLPINTYQNEIISPLNMDFDRENNRFTAHPGWYNDELIHYFKFHINGGTRESIQIPQIYIVTNDGTMDGAVGNPIISKFNGGEDLDTYSDYMRVNLVTAPEGYTADTFMSVGDVIDSNAVVNLTDIYLNLPLVPLGATLQHPNDKSKLAPIDPIPVWYKGVEVHSYLFEVTDEKAKTHFSYTRPDDEAGFEITVADFVNEDGTVVDAPIWIMNGYTRGVVAGENGGGPDPAGHKNIIGVDRGDTGYSPIWRMWWVTELPMNYNADEFSHPSQLFVDGVKTSEMPMWVNCPNVGVNGDVNPNKKTDGFEFEIDASKESNWVMGSDASHAMGGEKEIVISGVSTSTNGMGVYQHELKSCDIAPSATTVDVEFEGTTLREIEVVNRGDDSCEENAPAPTPDATIPDAPTPESATTSIFKRSALFANAIGFFLASLVL